MKDYPEGYTTVLNDDIEVDMSQLQKDYRNLIKIQAYLRKRGPKKFGGWVESIEGLLNFCEYLIDEHPVLEEDE